MTEYYKKSALKRKLLLLAFLPLFLMSFVLIVIVSSLHQANARIGTLYNDRVIPLQQIKQVSDAYTINLVDTSNKLLAGVITRDLALSNLNHAESTVTEAWQGYLQTKLIAEEAQLIKDAEPLLSDASALLNRIVFAIDTEDQELLSHIVTHQLYPVVDLLSQALTKLSSIQLVEAQRIFESNQKNLHTMYWFSASLVGTVFVGLIFLIRKLSNTTMQTVSATTKSTVELFTLNQFSVDGQDSYMPEEKSHLLETIENIRQQLGLSIEETMRLLSTIPAPVVGIWDTKGTVSSINYAFERQFELPREDVVGQHIEHMSFWPENEAMQAVKSHLKAAREGSSSIYRIQLEINQGRRDCRLFFITVSSWRQNKQVVTLMLFEDVTVWHKRELLLNEKISRDPLTQLLNRDGFNQVMEELWFRWKAYKEPFALVMVDLNDFKVVNDTYGHVIGDAVLKECASRLKHSIRETDICVRWGGDEFAIVLKDCQSLRAAELQIERTAESLGRAICVQEFEKQMHASFGCIHVTEAATQDVSSIEELIHLADARMYEAKRQAKQQIT